MSSSIVNVNAAGESVESSTMIHASELLLDDEIKQEIHLRLKRELARPQYKKELFFTGSLMQVGGSSSVQQQQLADSIGAIAMDNGGVFLTGDRAAAVLHPSSLMSSGSRPQIVTRMPAAVTAPQRISDIASDVILALTLCFASCIDYCCHR